MRARGKILYNTFMSLVENLINQISTEGLGGITKPIGFDLNDDTFANLLEKQMNISTDSLSSTNPLGSLGAPAGLIIEPLDGTEFSETVQDQMEIIGETKLSRDEYINQPIEFKDIDMGDYFSSLLKTQSGSNSDFLSFARKNATNAYDSFKRTYIADMQDFVEDLASNL